MHHAASDWNLLARYLLGECSAEEVEAVGLWMAADAQRRAEVELMQRVSTLARELPSAEDVDRMWARTLSALEPAAGGERHGEHRKAVPLRVVRPLMLPSAIRSGRRRWLKPLAAAATLVLAIGGMSVLWSRIGARGPAERHAALREFRTVRGQRASITLLDGTRVALGPASRLRVTIAEAGPREVALDGEAVFEVIHDSTRPFLVRAGAAVTEDLGTRFGVRAYTGEPVQIVVAEGAVAVRDTLSDTVAAVLGATDAAWVDSDRGVIVERAVDADAYLSWMNGRLVFRHARLRDVVVQLERWFDVQIVAEDSSLLATTVNVSFNDDSIDYVIRALAVSLDVQADRRGRLVYLRSRH